MKLDHELVRALLLEIEDQQWSAGWTMAIGSDEFARYYTVERLMEGGFVNGQILPVDDDEGGCVMVQGLTYRGHEFLDTVRDPRAWNAAKMMAHKAGSVALDVLVAAAKAWIAGQLREVGIPGA